MPGFPEGYRWPSSGWAPWSLPSPTLDIGIPAPQEYLPDHGASGTYRPRGATSITCRARPLGRSRSQALSWVQTWNGAVLGRGAERGGCWHPTLTGDAGCSWPCTGKAEKGEISGSLPGFSALGTGKGRVLGTSKSCVEIGKSLAASESQRAGPSPVAGAGIALVPTKDTPEGPSGHREQWLAGKAQP